ncbi:hypothetical protein BJ138DRAFT_1007282 [Hygrophoropsis aurantiaca]|uniref:Uncharacterized protein n=1 Tax=Hygrophoropsis aurantiaca TaxID=72124 RepID=A0ACB8ADF0_9AGAM|nr:hypothetical protein BJ138DRAFT_1007282 [Hygrophoropsis aurantiaca]
MCGPNPLRAAVSIVEHMHNAATSAKQRAPTGLECAKAAAEELNLEQKYNDLTIQFIGASDLPKMDVVGWADPYFHANLDQKLSFVHVIHSTFLQPNTNAPVWNEVWKVKNVPSTACLKVVVRDKDDGSMVDDYIGSFETTVSSGTKEVEIVSAVLKRNKGTFWLKIESSPSADDAQSHPYLFDGPIRYSRHSSPTAGALTNLKDTRLYSTWKIYIKGIPLFFGDRMQPWNRKYKAAQAIFQGPTSIAVRAGIQAGHRMLYARTASNGFGTIITPDDVFNLLQGGSLRSAVDVDSQSYAHRVKPAVYTYIIANEDQSFRFSETGAAFFVDFASKHALHSNCAESVRYSGEFHPRPTGGWENFSDDIPDREAGWELVIDNNSGTYSPDPSLLPDLKALLEYNFPGFTVVALDHDDPELKKSTDACREYALTKRGVKENELQPHASIGEETLWHQASSKRPKCVAAAVVHPN